MRRLILYFLANPRAFLFFSTSFLVGSSVFLFKIEVPTPAITTVEIITTITACGKTSALGIPDNTMSSDMTAADKPLGNIIVITFILFFKNGFPHDIILVVRYRPNNKIKDSIILNANTV